MTSYVPAALRRLVAGRAGDVCEYCLIDQDDTYFGCEVEHIISEKHGGFTTPRRAYRIRIRAGADSQDSSA